jgi:hypothetical protein
MHELSKAYDVLMQLSSKKGYKAGEYTLKADFPLVSRISSEGGVIDLDFISDEKPVISVKKIFTIRITVLGISLRKDGGTVRLDNFPDKSFNYDDDLAGNLNTFFEEE